MNGHKRECDGYCKNCGKQVSRRDCYAGGNYGWTDLDAMFEPCTGQTTDLINPLTRRPEGKEDGGE